MSKYFQEKKGIQNCNNSYFIPKIGHPYIAKCELRMVADYRVDYGIAYKIDKGIVYRIDWRVCYEIVYRIDYEIV